MKRLLPALLALGVLSPVSPASAQERGEAIAITSSHPHDVRTVYRHALAALEANGYELRVRSLDEVLMTQPRFAPGVVGQGEVGTQVLVEVAAAGDSTRLQIHGQVVPREGKPLARGSDEANANLLAALVQVSADLSERLESAPETAAPDPREAAGAFGYGPRAAVRVGGGLERGIQREVAWLERLRGPGGEAVSFVRLGSCCAFPTKTSPNGTGLLDAYEVTYPGLAAPVVLYLNMYEPPRPQQGAPEGFVLAPEEAPTAGGQT